MPSKASLPAGGDGSRPAALQVLRFGDVEIDAAARELVRAGTTVPIHRKIFDLLLMLVEARPQTVTRDALSRALWGRESVPANAVARAVLEARRAIGDTDADAPWIVDVHGVGYRFQGQVTRSPGPAAGHAGGRPDTVQSHLQAAELAFWQHNDADRTREHVEQALAAALNDGLCVEAGQALCWLAWLSMWSGKVEAALRHVAHAQHVACRTQHAMLAARAQTVEAYIHLSIDEPEEALVRLEAAHPVLAEDGHVGWLHRCEALLGAATRGIGDLDAARHWSRQALRTLQSEPLELPRLRAMGNEATLDLEIGDRLEAEGQADAARQAWTSALSIVDQVLEHAGDGVDVWLVGISLTHRAQLLGRLGRPAQAGAALDQAEALLARDEHRLQGPALLELRMNVHVDRIRLRLRAGELDGARRALQAALIQAARTDPQGPWMPALHELAAELAERSGDLPEALRCARRQQAAHRVQQERRAGTLALALQIRSQQDAAGEELQSLQEHVLQLERLNAGLLRQLHGGTRAVGTTVSEG